MSLCRSLRNGAKLTIPDQPRKSLCGGSFFTTLPVAVQFVVDTRSSMYDCACVAISAPYSLTDCRRFFAKPATARQRQYDALRAFYMDQLPSAEVARRFGYLQEFFSATRPGRRDHPKKSRAHDQIIALRKRNYSVYEISQALKEQGTPLSATAVREVLAAEGFAPLPRRLDEERPKRVGPSAEAVADVC